MSPPSPKGVATDQLAAHFDAKYRDNADPWNYRGSWYERRKYALTMACLPRERYRRAWEPACSIGELTALLAQRCDAVEASDISESAVSAATSRLASFTNVSVQVAALPVEPSATCDLVVLSEVLYYLEPSAREQTLCMMETQAEAGTDLIVVSWRHHPDDAWESGAAVSAAIRQRDGWQSMAVHNDEHFVLDVLRRR